MNRQNNRTNNRTNKKSNMKTNYYVEGNTVRRLEGEPEERRRKQHEREIEQRRRQNHHAAKRNQEKALRMNKGYVAFCTLALILTCGVCVTYIQVQSDNINRMRTISNLESQITEMKADNDAALKRIDMANNLEVVKDTAINSLGMIYPGTDQIVYYSIADNDYMNQLSEIPEK